MREDAKFCEGEMALFLGSDKSFYGRNKSMNKYDGEYITIGQVHKTANPVAYTIYEFEKEYGFDYWVSENCFEKVELPELPEFDVCEDIGILF